MTLSMSDYSRTLLEFQHFSPDETACAQHIGVSGPKGSDARPVVRSLISDVFRPSHACLNVARVEALTSRDFYEGPWAHSNPAESDEPVLTG